MKFKQRLLPTVVFSLIGMFALFSCQFTSEEELYPPKTCDTTNVSFATHIKPIFEKRCYGCHSNATSATSGSGVSFEGYNNIKTYITQGNGGGKDILLGAINRKPGFPQMPKNLPKIPECEIRQIEIWIAAGALDN